MVGFAKRNHGVANDCKVCVCVCVCVCEREREKEREREREKWDNVSTDCQPALPP